MADATKRMSFFDRQFLRAADFQDEQAYHVDRRRRHNRLLHTPGVAEGLNVKGKKPDSFVTVTPGTAYDELGRETVLASDVKVDVSQIAGDSAYITIAYSEQPTDASTDPGVTGNSSRWSEVPALSAISKLPAPNLTLVLAKVPLSGGKVNDDPDNSVRASAGTVVGDDLTLHSLTVKTTVKAAAFQGDGSALTGVSATDNTKVAKAGDTMTGPLSIAGNTTTPLVTVTQSGTTGNPVGLSVNAVGAAVDGSGLVGLRGNANAAGGFGVVGNAVAGARAGQFNGDVAVTGKVGIGVANPAESLEASGRIKSGALTIGPWPANPGNYVFVGTNALDQTKDGNYALLQGVASEKGVTFLNSPEAIKFRIGNADKMLLAKDGSVDMNGALRLANSDLYFTKPDHDHTGFGNTPGFAAIENAKNYGALMILGRSTGPNAANPQRVVKLWDFLEINGKLEVTGDAAKPGGGSWTALSDRRLKKNINPLGGALDKLLGLRGVCFEWKQPERYGNLTGTQMGLIAQDVEKVFPEWVGVDSGGFKTVTVRGLEALVIEAFRELKEENEALKEAVAELQSKLGIQAKDQKSAGKKAVR